jgi:TolB protein
VTYPRLREALADLASDVTSTDVTSTDLTARALRTSRRLSLRRTIVAALGVLVVLGGSAVAGVAAAPRHGVPAARASQDTPSATTSPGVAAVDGSSSGTGRSDCPVAAAPTDPGPSPYNGPAPQVALPDTGPLYYLQTGTAGPVRLVSWTPGSGAPVTLRTLPADARMNANVSPDGRWVSWVTLDDGALHVAALRPGGGEQVLRRSVDGRLLEPVWSPDSTRLLVRDQASDRVGTVSVPAGTFSPLAVDLAGARHAVWAADGSKIAYLTADGQLMVAEPDGSGQRRIPVSSQLLGGGRQILSLQSMSGTAAPGGDGAVTMTVGQPGQHPDGCRSLVSNSQVRVSNGQPLGSEAQGGGRYTQFQAVYRGKYFSHVSRGLGTTRSVALIGDNGEFWGGAVEPAALAGYLLLNT